MIETVWGENPIRRDMSIGAATIDFLNLGDFRELQMELHGLQQNVGASDIALQFSTDNGATWDVTAGNYVLAADAAGAIVGVPLTAALPVQTSLAGLVEIFNFNSSWQAVTVSRCGRLASSTQVKTGPTYHTPLVGRNAIRLICTNPFTMNLGVLLRTRKL